MDYILKGISEAVWMILSLNKEVYSITFVSLKVSVTSTILATLLGVPIGFLVAVREFWGRAIVVTLLNTLMALPTVVVGLTVYSAITRRGPLGGLGLLYTPTAMVIGQVILATPIIAALTLSTTQGIDKRILQTAATLGANRFQSAITLLLEAKLSILAAVIAGFGRVFAEVGASMMLGGNIRGFTRNIPTAIAFETGKGNFSLGIALGLILLSMAFAINILFHQLQKKEV